MEVTVKSKQAPPIHLTTGKANQPWRESFMCPLRRSHHVLANEECVQSKWNSIPRLKLTIINLNNLVEE